MIKSNKGISLVSLIITIAVMMIISSIAVNMSMDRFEINNLNKMINDLELLEDKVSNYYLKYNRMPIARNSENNAIKYTYTTIDFEKSAGDNENYYIVDLEALGDGVSLNYGKDGFENPNSSEDVYIINEKTHSIYYVKGIEMKGKYYHSILRNDSINDTIPPSKPEIKIISGAKNEEGKYTTEVRIEIIPGKDNWSGVSKTEYSINNGSTWNDLSENNILTLLEEGNYNIIAKTYDNNQNTSTTDTITIEIITVTQELLSNNVIEGNQVEES